MNFNRVVVLLRSVAGAGKSTVASYLSTLNSSASTVICCADDHFTSADGSYNFNPAELNVAHQKCQDKFVESLKRGVTLVVVANTNVKPSQFDFYLDNAREYGYTVFSLVVEKRFDGGDNGHKVPEKSLQMMENNIKISLKLR